MYYQIYIILRNGKRIDSPIYADRESAAKTVENIDWELEHKGRSWIWWSFLPYRLTDKNTMRLYYTPVLRYE